jgi:hypothetical protein
MEVSTSTWSSTKWVRAFATKGAALPILESVHTRFLGGMPVVVSKPLGPCRYLPNKSLNLGEPT